MADNATPRGRGLVHRMEEETGRAASSGQPLQWVPRGLMLTIPCVQNLSNRRPTRHEYGLESTPRAKEQTSIFSGETLKWIDV
ncbi:hypothetical protein CGMCC3_g17739 [Colletotrichum fructicola]|nr:uncharacterized protein CGMCC3_g17739 [Colletotrichum fructicola]KAE9566084.1 hypothetical protein CGMCC3_g17739 [Colletotrichum fructicola]